MTTRTRLRRPAPACGCTLHARCAEAHRLRDAHHAQFVEAMRLPSPTTSHQGLQAARNAYAQHLRQAGVKPGQARWEDGT